MKKHIIIPAALLLYLVGVAYYTYPERNPGTGLSFTQYYITVAITLVVIIAAGFLIKKKEKNAQKYKDMEKEERLKKKKEKL